MIDADARPDRESQNPVAEAKRAARARALSARAGLDRAARDHAAAAASQVLLGLPELAHARVVLAYAALSDEIDPLAAVSALRHHGVTIAYPRIQSPGLLDLHVVSDERELVPGPFGLSQPVAESPLVEVELVDAVIIPGVAFDACGRRLGYGGGYYDRLLPSLGAGCTRIGFAFAEQILAEIPAEPHDAVVDLVVTQNGVIRPLAQER